MKKLLLLWLLCTAATTYAQTDKEQILQVLDMQMKAWNSGSIEQYMTGYWHSDSLVFVGKSGPTYGYDATLQRYKQSYNNTDKMGQLHFDILQVRQLSAEYYYVLGKWALARNAGDVSGSFTLLFRKIKGQWRIVADHSS
ncbi:MAG: nuclear transport factor 2 family protein [Chitinophagales bacterium]|nr:nuclear transport factor 2 family protein [Chitinophagales bacterium]